ASMHLEAVLFDLDGTLLDTLEDLADSANAALRRLGLPQHPVESFKRFIGDGVETLVRRALPPEHHDPQTLARCAELLREEYGRRWAD
ncbi:MAG: HAD hydrolase-like protein, partial [Thermoguttaceae bacterium]|nr:HAD hydrolase-like protein [Thermoguttaceae bacterium]